MLSGLFAEKPVTTNQTRFERCTEMKQIHPLLAKLRAKIVDLKINADSIGVGSLEYRKYMILEKLMQEIDDTITNYNNKTDNEKKYDRVCEILTLVELLGNIINSYGATYGKILNTARNAKKEVADTAVSVSTYSMFAAAAWFTPITTIGRLAAILFIAPPVSYKARDLAGTDNPHTASMSILMELVIALHNIEENLSFLKDNLLDPDELDIEEVHEDLKM